MRRVVCCFRANMANTSAQFHSTPPTKKMRTFYIISQKCDFLHTVTQLVAYFGIRGRVGLGPCVNGVVVGGE